MIEIIPAILPKDYEDLKNKIALVRGVVPLVQIDICDGIFVKTVTWPFSSRAKSRDSGEYFFEDYLDEHFKKILREEEGLPFWEDIDFEFDLMVSDAVENFDIYTKLGVKRIIFHIDAIGDLEEFRDFLEGMDPYVKDNIELGIAVNLKTNLELIFPIINFIDFVQCMGIEHIGFQGQDFDDRVLEQIKTLREKFPDLIISVDGGVDLNMAPALASAGASRLVVGSAIFNSDDIIDTIEKFRQI